jgi:predicted AlkP superfamily phosphohydrolase/phosphomutase
MTTAQRALLIGLDSATLHLLDRYVAEGRCPNLGRLMERGYTTEAYPSLPPGTAMNWNTIVTGCHPGTHGVTAMSMHTMGDPLDEKTSGFFSYHCRAERLWEAAVRGGKLPILLRYTTSWPPTIEEGQGIQVEGFSDPDWNVLALAPRAMFSHEKLHEGISTCTSPPENVLGMAHRATPRAAQGWATLPESKQPLLEVELRITPTKAEPVALVGLFVDSVGEGYDRVALYTDRSAGEPLAELGVSEWSDWIALTFNLDGSPVQGRVRFRLLELAPDGTRFRLYQSQIFPDSGWTLPEGLGPDLVERFGPYQELGGLWCAYLWRWVTPGEAEQLYGDEMAYQIRWLGAVGKHLMAAHQWSLLCTQFHGIDHMDHMFLSCLDPGHRHHEVGSRIVARTYELADEYVGMLLDAVGEDAVVCVTSDHGHTEILGDWLAVNDLLEQAGLLAYAEPPAPAFAWRERPGYPATNTDRRIDWTKTKAALVQDGYVYVNLKGREPHGIVAPDEYESVRDAVVRLLEGAESPDHPGERFCQIVVKREDAECLGLWGPGVGDVIFFGKTSVIGSHHGNWPGGRGKYGGIPAVTIFAGPGIKRGVRRPHPIHLTDVAPTIAELAGIPRLRDAEGRVVWDVLEQ